MIKRAVIVSDLFNGGSREEVLGSNGVGLIQQAPRDPNTLEVYHEDETYEVYHAMPFLLEGATGNVPRSNKGYDPNFGGNDLQDAWNEFAERITENNEFKTNILNAWHECTMVSLVEAAIRGINEG
ncbi:hypothetical protein FACS1894109_11100 [Spirochaetia bacterium]|nr:hypothetical protein FACS1894109_11100 [Spirochaetia bacterium]